MNFVGLAFRRPLSMLVIVIGLATGGIVALRDMRYDIFPTLDIPTIYVAQPYAGMQPDQMESFLTYFYEYQFLYIGGIAHVESRSVPNAAILKLEFHEGTDMGQAMADTVGNVVAARAFMPPGTVPPFILRFDAGNVPVGDLLFYSRTASVAAMQDAALNLVRPLFGTLPGVSAPAPFGGAPRSIVINLRPDRLSAYNLSPEDVVKAMCNANLVTPSGQAPIKDNYPFIRLNSTVQDIQDLAAVPIRTGVYPAIFLRDIATVEDSTDIITCYALVNGRPTVYLPVTKRPDASTLTVVNLVRQSIPMFQNILPPDQKVTYGFDQSPYVTRAINGLAMEGALGGLLTGLMILLFLWDWRSSLIVIVNIPLSVMSAALALWLTGQTINIMTLGGLALAVGILVDEATVCIENIHVHLDAGESLSRAALDATNETTGPRLLSMLCILSMFTPAAFMVGAARSMFFPLSLAVGFSMIASYVLSSTLAPILSVWILRAHQQHAKTAKPSKNRFGAFQKRYSDFLRKVIKLRWVVVGSYLAAATVIIVLVGSTLGAEIYPTVNAGQLQVRLQAPAGTKLEITKDLTIKTLDIIKNEVGAENVEISVGFVGNHNPNYAANLLFLFMTGPEQSILQVQFKSDAPVRIGELREKLRKLLPEQMPGVNFSFEPGDIVSQVMSLGAASPIEIVVYGPKIDRDAKFAKTIKEKISSIPGLRDLHLGQVLDYPTLDLNLDRERSGIMGVDMSQAARALVPAVWSSRFMFPLYWGDPNSDCTYQIQVQTPQEIIESIETVKNTQVSYGSPGSRSTSLLRNLATFSNNVAVEEYAHFDNQRMITVNANLAPGSDVGTIGRKVSEVIHQMGSLPSKVTVLVRGQVVPLNQMMEGLRNGLFVAMIVIFLLLTATLQSLRLPLLCLSTAPAVISGVILALKLTGTTLNIQSFTGAIMSIGVAMANAILLVIFAERARVTGWRTRFLGEGKPKSSSKKSTILKPTEGRFFDSQFVSTAVDAALIGASTRLRPILMTSLAMISGMIPMALGWSEGGEQTAPLGRAVVGGLAMATLATLLVLPSVFAIVQKRTSGHSASVHPDDSESLLYNPKVSSTGNAGALKS
ncbi:MAG: efflux RND transporter permease subunit [Desulfomonilaceae bacterium]